MKNLFISLLILIASRANGQTFTPLMDTSLVWHDGSDTLPVIIMPGYNWQEIDPDPLEDVYNLFDSSAVGYGFESIDGKGCMLYILSDSVKRVIIDGDTMTAIRGLLALIENSDSAEAKLMDLLVLSVSWFNKVPDQYKDRKDPVYRKYENALRREGVIFEDEVIPKYRTGPEKKNSSTSNLPVQ